jgi:hypothetical protein
MEGEYFYSSHNLYPKHTPILFKNPNPSNSRFSTFEVTYTLDPKNKELARFKALVKKNSKTPLTMELNDRIINQFNFEENELSTNYTLISPDSSPSIIPITPTTITHNTKNIVYSGSIFYWIIFSFAVFLLLFTFMYHGIFFKGSKKN